MNGAAPAKQPCASCPYRRDVPSGVWSAHEYEKLPAYDRPTGEQPPSAFFCHQRDGRLCAGWVGCHDMENSLGLRMAVAVGILSREDAIAACDYTTDVPLWGSGAAAAAHGMAEIPAPSNAARTLVAKLDRRPRPKRGV